MITGHFEYRGLELVAELEDIDNEVEIVYFDKCSNGRRVSDRLRQQCIELAEAAIQYQLDVMEDASYG